MRIAVLLTCHNRRQKTENCLRSFKVALMAYNAKVEDAVDVEVFLTDDGCTDGTIEGACGIFSLGEDLHILEGDGNLFWAGGMRYCWREALKKHSEWDYYLLLNDDVELMPCMFDELFNAQKYAKECFGNEGVVSGITCDTENQSKMTYGGYVWANKFLATYTRLPFIGKPQMCDLTNANVLFVNKSVVDKIGIFYEGYRHGIADFDYSNTARRSGIPVILTAGFCGKCENDHVNPHDVSMKVIGMSLKERKAYFKNPLHSSKDYLKFVRRTSPIRWPMVWFGRTLNLYLPTVYYYLSGDRHVK